MSFTLNSKSIQLILKAGAAAPSGGNAQPWRVKVLANQFIISAHPQKSNTLLQTNNYDAIFALGCFTENIIVAANHINLDSQITFKRIRDPKHFQINITFSPTKEKKAERPNLYQSIFDRNTNRQLYDGNQLESKYIAKLAQVTSLFNHNFSLHHISSSKDKDSAAQILGKVDVIRTKNIQLHQKMMSEIRWTDHEAKSSNDGIDIKTLELPGNVSKMLKLLTKYPKLVNTIPDIALEKNSEPILTNCSHLCILSTNLKITPKSIYLAGRLSELIWLHATTSNLALQPWTVLSFLLITTRLNINSELTKNQKFVVNKADRNLKQLFSIPANHQPAFIFRLSTAKPPSAKALRYNWREFTEIN